MYFSQPNRFPIFIAICFLIFLIGIFKIPILDRDEARFATASKTMLYEKDYLDIKMYDEFRYKKPIGIYWLQVTSNFIFGNKPYDKISIYRLPSILCIFLSFILIFYILRRIYSDEIAFLTVFFLMFSLISLSEMHQAKTDGALFLTICACNLITFKMIKENSCTKKSKYCFSVFLAVGVLIKGPIILFFTILPLLLFSIIKKTNFFKELFNIPSLLLFLIISVPWFVIITVKSAGLFWHESVGNDLFNKVKSGQESHGFPPGYYLLTTILLFWPGSIFIFAFIKKKSKGLFREIRKNDLNFFLLLSFFVPYILYEMVPTKLPHYIFPAYFPLSVLLSKFLCEQSLTKSNRVSIIPFVLIFPVTTIILISYLIYEYSEFSFDFFLIIFLLFVVTYKLLVNFSMTNIDKNLNNLAIFQISFYLTLVFYVNDNLEDFWISKKINSVIELNKKDYESIYNFGFNEPSLVFLTSHKSEKKDPNALTQNDLKNRKIMFIINNDFSSSLDLNDKYKDFHIVEEFDGFNYSKGKKVSFKVFSNKDDQ